MESFIGFVHNCSFNFAPVYYSFCSGQILAINQFTALYSLIGTRYGGDGRSTMALPDLRARYGIGSYVQGQPTPPLQPVGWGQFGGFQQRSLSESQMPVHSHAAVFTPATISSVEGNLVAEVAGANSTKPADDYHITATKDGLNPGDNIYTPTASQTVELNGVKVYGNSGAGGTVVLQDAGTGAAINCMNPYQGMAYVIAYEGLYPSRN